MNYSEYYILILNIFLNFFCEIKSVKYTLKNEFFLHVLFITNEFPEILRLFQKHTNSVSFK